MYRVVDSEGNTIDFMLSPNRDLMAAKHFLQLALWRTREVRPRVITWMAIQRIENAGFRPVREINPGQHVPRACNIVTSPVATLKLQADRVLATDRSFCGPQ